MGKDEKYSKYIFINCPFDEEYNPIFEIMVFTIHGCGFLPRCAKEEGEEIQLTKIEKIISECKYGVHDISRTKRMSFKLPRFNMPFELGLFRGCKRYGKNRKKRILVLDSKEYRFLETCSDIRGMTLRAHHNKPWEAMFILRNWIEGVSQRKTIPGYEEIWIRYNQFKKYVLPEWCKDQKLRQSRLTFLQYSWAISDFLVGP